MERNFSANLPPAGFPSRVILGIGVNMLKLRKSPVKVGNMLPAIFVPLLYLPLAQWLGGLFG